MTNLVQNHKQGCVMKKMFQKSIVSFKLSKEWVNPFLDDFLNWLHLSIETVYQKQLHLPFTPWKRQVRRSIKTSVLGELHIQRGILQNLFAAGTCLDLYWRPIKTTTGRGHLHPQLVVWAAGSSGRVSHLHPPV